MISRTGLESINLYFRTVGLCFERREIFQDWKVFTSTAGLWVMFQEGKCSRTGSCLPALQDYGSCYKKGNVPGLEMFTSIAGLGVSVLQDWGFMNSAR